jgi:hypothetical protein
VVSCAHSVRRGRARWLAHVLVDEDGGMIEDDDVQSARLSAALH